MSWPQVIGIAASVVTVLAFLGFTTAGKLFHEVFGPRPSPTPTHSASRTPTPSPTILHSQAIYSPSPDPSTFDPGKLNNSATDDTPFTVEALLPWSFTASDNVQYKRVAAAEQACGGSGYISSNVQSTLLNNTCAAVMTGDYVENSPAVTSSNDVLVSVQVMPFDTAETADYVYSSFPRGGNWNFGIWCPLSGPGADDCTQGFATAIVREVVEADHRYLVEATAVYTDLASTLSSEAEAALESAAAAAVDESGPQNYPGNQP